MDFWSSLENMDIKEEVDNHLYFLWKTCEVWKKNNKLGGGNSKIFYFHPGTSWGNHPIWLIYIFQMGVETTN